MTQAEFEFIEGIICNKCGEEKPTGMYYHHPGTRNKRIKVCKPCKSKEQQLVIRLKKGFESLRPEVCECCGGKGLDKLQIDHCHGTGHFRGFLCRSCNQIIGNLGDSYEAIEDKDLDPMYEHYLYIAGLRSGINKRVISGRESSRYKVW